MRERFAVLLAISIGACAPAPIMLPLPAAEGDRAMIVAAAEGLPRLGFELRSLAAIDLASRAGADQLDRAVLPEDGSLEVELTALSFDQPLDQLGFHAGALTIAEPGQPGQPLPLARALHQTILSAEGAPTWTAIDDLDGSLTALRVR